MAFPNQTPTETSGPNLVHRGCPQACRVRGHLCVGHTSPSAPRRRHYKGQSPGSTRKPTDALSQAGRLTETLLPLHSPHPGHPPPAPQPVDSTSLGPGGTSCLLSHPRGRCADSTKCPGLWGSSWDGEAAPENVGDDQGSFFMTFVESPSGGS